MVYINQTALTIARIVLYQSRDIAQHSSNSGRPRVLAPERSQQPPTLKLPPIATRLQDHQYHLPHLSTHTHTTPQTWSLPGKPPVSRTSTSVSTPSEQQGEEEEEDEKDDGICGIHMHGWMNGDWEIWKSAWRGTVRGLKTQLLMGSSSHRYNRYLAVAARVVRRSLKDDLRLAADKRGEMDLRFAKWEVCFYSTPPTPKERRKKKCGGMVGWSG